MDEKSTNLRVFLPFTTLVVKGFFLCPLKFYIKKGHAFFHCRDKLYLFKDEKLVYNRVSEPIDVIFLSRNIYCLFNNNLQVLKDDFTYLLSIQRDQRLENGKIMVISDESFINFEFPSKGKTQNIYTFITNKNRLEKSVIEKLEHLPLVMNNGNLCFGDKKFVSIYDPLLQKVVKKIEPHKQQISHIQKLNNGNIVTSSFDKSIKVLDQNLNLLKIVSLKDVVYKIGENYEGYLLLHKEFSICIMI